MISFGPDFGPDRRHRRPNLTPMIDVVFLLLVFFMLASRFGTDTALPLASGGLGAGYSGPPRLVEFGPAGLSLNGVPTAPDALATALAPLTTSPDDPIILRPQNGADLQAMVQAMEHLRNAGFSRLVLLEAAR